MVMRYVIQFSSVSFPLTKDPTCYC